MPDWAMDVMLQLQNARQPWLPVASAFVAALVCVSPVAHQGCGMSNPFRSNGCVGSLGRRIHMPPNRADD